jgi:hypothetical protein
MAGPMQIRAMGRGEAATSSHHRSMFSEKKNEKRKKKLDGTSRKNVFVTLIQTLIVSPYGRVTDGFDWGKVQLFSPKKLEKNKQTACHDTERK